jgi:acid phosphatase (class A)
MKWVVAAVVVIGIGGFAAHVHSPTGETLENELLFSNTQNWDEDLYGQRSYSVPNPIVGLATTSYDLAAPPANNSATTKAELATLLALQAERTTEDLAAISAELELETTQFAGRPYPEYVNPFRPATQELVHTSLRELTGLIFDFKEYFDRVRPSFLEPTLDLAIENPDHPAYPSGHATQSYFIALIFSDLDPDNRQAYLNSAVSIADNREIAGVHYASDSTIGRELAQQYFDRLQQTKWYQTQLTAAKTEWE